MLRRKIVLLCSFLFISSVLYADTVYMKDGRIFDGTIIEKNNYSLKMSINGRPEIIYLTQIERIVKDEDLGKNVNVDPASFENISKEKVELIIELVIANGLTSNLQRSAEDAIKSAPPERREEFKQLFNFDELVRMLIPIFDLYYSDEELKDLIKIYQMPVRQKEIENTPAIIKEALEKMLKHIYDKSQVSTL